jgi:Tfp pilus assembly protein PilN
MAGSARSLALPARGRRQQRNSGRSFLSRLAPNRKWSSIDINESSLRAVVTRNDRVIAWAERPMPEGVVRDGVVTDAAAFVSAVSGLLQEAGRGNTSNLGDVAMVISGRNAVQQRFLVEADDQANLARAVADACADRMPVSGEALQLDWAAVPLEAGDPRATGRTRHVYDVYAFGVLRHAIESNVSAVAGLPLTLCGLQPKALALAAAADLDDGIVVDIEPESITVLALQNGLPEVIREAAIGPAAGPEVIWLTVRNQLAKAVVYFNSLHPESPMPNDAPLVLTGSFDRLGDAGMLPFHELPFELRDIQAPFRTPASFDSARFAAALGLAVLSRPRPLLRSPVGAAERVQQFEFRPAGYRPRSLPAARIAAVAAQAALGAAAGLMIAMAPGANADRAALRAAGESADLQLEARETDAATARAALAEAASMKARTEEISTRTEFILGRQDRLAASVAAVFSLAPAEVTLESVNDNNTVARLTATSQSRQALFDYVSRLDQSGTFLSVTVASFTSNDGAPALSPVTGLPDGVRDGGGFFEGGGAITPPSSKTVIAGSLAPSGFKINIDLEHYPESPAPAIRPPGS